MVPWTLLRQKTYLEHTYESDNSRRTYQTI
ncbi:unnamed protein product [Nezara viridula]|uniref:Uncharacterized protein n=1 Tax=Nezara viridula TaxID=85310 RepID=A0A9P0H8V0_NEZVI|nr:unnamed protein product [Nezara viridula]